MTRLDRADDDETIYNKEETIGNRERLKNKS